MIKTRVIPMLLWQDLSLVKGVNFKNDDTSTILDTSIVTNKKYWKKNSISKLKFILERYIKENK